MGKKKKTALGKRHLGRLEGTGRLGRVGQSLGSEPKPWCWASLWVWGHLGWQGSFPWTYNNEALAVLEGPLQGLCSGSVAWGPQVPGACLPVVSVVNHGGKNLYSAYIVAPQSWDAKKRTCTTQIDCNSNADNEDSKDWRRLYHWMRAWWPHPVWSGGQRCAFSKLWLNVALLYPGLQLLLHPGSRREMEPHI